MLWKIGKNAEHLHANVPKTWFVKNAEYQYATEKGNYSDEWKEVKCFAHVFAPFIKIDVPWIWYITVRSAGQVRMEVSRGSIVPFWIAWSQHPIGGTQHGEGQRHSPMSMKCRRVRIGVSWDLSVLKKAEKRSILWFMGRDQSVVFQHRWVCAQYVTCSV